MSLQWTLIAGFLYAEIAIVILLVLPIISARRWNSIFKSRFLQGLQHQAGLYFILMLGVLVLFLLDAIREMRKYSNVEEGEHKHLDAEMQGSMRLFRAQRNFYISGFALFLAFVIRRLVILISAQAGLLAQSEASLKQAESATTAARSFLTQKGVEKTKDNEEVDKLKEQIKQLEAKLKSEEANQSALKTQAKNLATEYDRLTEEHSKLQKQVTSSGDKKDD